MLLRLRTPDGMFRLTMEKDNTFSDLGHQVRGSVRPVLPSPHSNLLSQLLPKLPSTVDPKTISLSNHPSGGDSKLLGEIAKFKIGQIGLGYVGRLLLLQNGTTELTRAQPW